MLNLVATLRNCNDELRKIHVVDLYVRMTLQSGDFAVSCLQQTHWSSRRPPPSSLRKSTVHFLQSSFEWTSYWGNSSMHYSIIVFIELSTYILGKWCCNKGIYIDEQPNFTSERRLQTPILFLVEDLRL